MADERDDETYDPTFDDMLDAGDYIDPDDLDDDDLPEELITTDTYPGDDED